MAQAPDTATWVALGSILTSVCAALVGIYTGRNARLKDRDAYALQAAQEEEKARIQTLLDLKEQNAYFAKRVRELEDEITEQRRAWEQERKSLAQSRDKAWLIANRWFERAHDLRHGWINAVQGIASNLTPEQRALMVQLRLPDELPDRDAIPVGGS